MMKCKFYSDEIGKCLFDGPPDDCPFENDEDNCACFESKMIECGSSDMYNDKHEDRAIELPKYSARISIGDLQIDLTGKTFTEEQIKNMKEMLGWEVENL